MSALSPFQTLPLHVVDIIVGHVVGCSRLEFDGVTTGTNAYKMLLRPLQWVCCNFRAVAHLLYHSDLELILFSTPCSTGDLNDSHIDYLYLAKKIRIRVDERGIYSGEALEVLTQAPFEVCAFPLARSLMFAFGTDPVYNDMALDSLQIDTNIRLFAQRVKKISPAVKEIGVVIEQDASDGSHPCLGRLVSHLFQSVSRIVLDIRPVLIASVVLQLDWIRNLTHMTYTTDTLGQQPVELVRQNASTLEYLVLTYGQESVDSSLFASPDGGSVAFPHLHTLKMLCASFDSDEPRRISTDGILFPRLCSLKLNCHYPFGDDTIFRGNSATLECLDLYLDAATVFILRKHRVFTPTSHPRLQCVNIEVDELPISDSFATVTEAMQSMQSIGPGAVVRGISTSPPRGEILPALALL
ncbi:hypothetical protein IWW38_001996 [Coemansia aciculifera]|uniref:Uncharacterized protein n=1 Tax=Coemansia aciculifera TaxID=417176 RepID=A0ACC1M4R7_9FUNG|nr:hypothetical protein IWW38_001996 [Coemansia aciculifera]